MKLGGDRKRLQELADSILKNRVVIENVSEEKFTQLREWVKTNVSTTDRDTPKIFDQGQTEEENPELRTFIFRFRVEERAESFKKKFKIGSK